MEEVKPGVNMSNLKAINRAQILNQLKKSRKSRKEIAENIKLTPAAITILVNEMMQEGCIVGSSRLDDSGNVGRKKILLKLNKNYKYALGINIESNVASIGVGNLDFEILKTASFKIDKEMDVTEIMQLIVQACKNLLWNLNISKNDVLGIGVGIVGIIDSSKGTSKHAFGLWEEEVDIRSILFRELQLPVLLENNVRALALAEIELTEHKNIHNLLFVKYGPGIGSAIIIDKEIYKGSFNKAGEIGKTIICTNGSNRDDLERIGSIKSLIQEIKANYSSQLYPILDDLIKGDVNKINDNNVIRAYKSGEERVVSYLDRAIDLLLIGIFNYIQLFDPHKIIIYGELAKEKTFMDKLAKGIQAYDVNMANIIEKSILKQENCIGGIVLAVQKLYFEKGGILT